MDPFCQAKSTGDHKRAAAPQSLADSSDLLPHLPTQNKRSAEVP